MTKYQEVRAIALTVSQMLSLNLALHDAVTYNNEHDYPGYAAQFQALLEVIREQTGAWIDAADAEIQAENAKLREEQLEAENMELAEFR
jgi:hypothetical protein